MGASFEEKSVWVQLGATMLALVSYALVAGWMLSRGVTELPAYAAVFGVSVAAMVAVMVAGLVAAAISGRRDSPDERDRLIAWKAEHRSSWLLVLGVMAALAGLVLGMSSLWVAHALLIALFLSQLLAYVLQVVWYRRGV